VTGQNCIVWHVVKTIDIDVTMSTAVIVKMLTIWISLSSHFWLVSVWLVCICSI